jgi:DNA-binding transcriptional ArsR family regulator
MDQVGMNNIDQVARLFKILSDANRLKIIFIIGKNERSVSELINETGLSQTLVSFHLKVLRDSEMVDTERKGPFIYYRLKNTGLVDLLYAFNQYAVNRKEEMETGMLWPCPPWFVKKH